MGRAPCCDKVGLKKGPWTPEEDQKLVAYIQEHGHGSWRALPQKAGLLRCGKSCRLRWANYLRPDIKRGKFSVQEEQTIIQLHALLGNRWSAIATHLPKRTDNEIKNYWNTHLKKRLVQMGIDPVTHKPKADTLIVAGSSTSTSTSTSTSNLSHMAQWESARLEAESRLVRESKLRAKGLWPHANINITTSPTDIFSKVWRATGQGFELGKVEGTSPGLSSSACRDGATLDWTRIIHKWDKPAADWGCFTGNKVLDHCNWFAAAEEDRSSVDVSNGTSYLSLLQQAIRPSAQATKLLHNETKKFVATHKIELLTNTTPAPASPEKKPVIQKPQSAATSEEPTDSSQVLLPSVVLNEEGNCSSGRSDVSEVSKGSHDSDNVDLGDFHHLHSSNGEISSSGGGEGSNYDAEGFSTDMLLDLVVVPPPSAEDRSVSINALCTADENKDYWSNMFTSICNSPQGNHVGVGVGIGVGLQSIY